MVYKWERDFYKVSAQEAGEHIEKLQAKHGDEYLPKVILDDSRPYDALLHSCFEWRDDVAAEKYRLDQARGIVRNLTIVYEDDRGGVPQTVEVRAYVSTNEKNSRADYKPVLVAMQNDVMKHQVLKNAVEEVRQVEKKYANLLTLSEILEAYKVQYPA